MKILYIHQYFKTPETGGAVRSYHISRAMVEAGHSVELLTSHNSAEYLVKEIEGIKVHFLPVNYENSLGKIARLKAFFFFSISAYKRSKNLEFDLVYATSTPLSVVWTALKIKRKRKIPFIFEVRDLWPLAPKQLGIIKNPILLWLAERLEKKAYTEAKEIIALSPSMQKYIETTSGRKDVHCIPNFGDSELAEKVLAKTPKRTDLKFIIYYAGSFGFANDIPFLQEMIRCIGVDFTEQIELRFMGEGKFATQIQDACNKFPNTHFLGFLNKESVYEELAISDACLTTFLPFPVLETNSPNKFFDGLTIGNIALINFGGWLEDLIEENNCGFRLTIENIRTVLQELIQNPSKVDAIKVNAKAIARKDFDKENLMREVIKLL